MKPNHAAFRNKSHKAPARALTHSLCWECGLGEEAPPSSPSPRSRARTRSSSSRSRPDQYDQLVRHVRATSRRCALCTRTFRPRQSFAALAGVARLAAGRVIRSPPKSPRYAPHSLSLPQAPFSIRPWRGSNETLCRLSTIHRKAAEPIKRRLPNAKRRPGTEASENHSRSGSGASAG
jgi:hypothetical protein